jgi:hypothetical protein
METLGSGGGGRDVGEQGGWGVSSGRGGGKLGRPSGRGRGGRGYEVRAKKSRLPYCHVPRKKLFCGTRNRLNFYSFRRNSSCFAGRNTLGISFRAIAMNVKKAWNSVPKHFIEDKYTRNFLVLFRTIPQKIKMLGIPFKSILQKRKTVPNH